MFGSMGQTAVKNLGNGGTIDGDLVITGDLQVSGGGSLSFDEIIEGTQVIDVTSTEAFLIRKNSDAGDLLVADTTNMRVGIGGTPINQFSIIGDAAIKNINIYTNSDAAVTSDTGARIFTTGDGGSGIYGENGHLVIQGRAAGRDTVFLTGASATEAMRITSAGNVNMGSVTSAIQATGIHVAKGAAAALGHITIESSSNATSPPTLHFAKARGSAGSRSAINTAGGDILGSLTFTGFDGSHDRSGAEIQALSVATSSTGTDMPADLLFLTSADGSSSPAERMRIASDGKATFGGNVQVEDKLTLNRTGTGANSWDMFVSHYGSSDYGSLFVDSNESTGNFYIRDSSDNVDFVVTGGGNVGIGQSSPASGVILDTAGGHIQITGGNALLLHHSTGTSDTLIKSSVNNCIEFHNAGSESVRFDASGNVGIGTATPDTNLHIHKATAGNVASNSLAVATIEGDDHTALQFLTPADKNAIIYFGDVNDNDVGYINYAHSTNTMNFQVDQAVRMTLDANSRISLSNNGGEATNTIFGYQAGNSIHASSGMNTFVGHQVADATMTAAADENTAVGHLALSGLTQGYKNTVIGSYAGINITTGDENVMVGRSAGNAFNSSYVVAIGTMSCGSITNATADGTVGVGHQALTALTTGDGNTALGYQSATAMTTGARNVIIGYQAGDAMTKTTRSVAIGYGALGAEDVGDRSIAVGFNALASQNSDSDNETTGNVGIGVESGFYNITGTNNTYLGYNSGKGASEQSNSANTGVGEGSLLRITTGGDNASVGRGSLSYNTTGNSSVGIGIWAGMGNATGSDNVYVGSSAGKGVANNNNSNNVGIGKDAMVAVTTGSSNTVVGANAGDAITTQSNCVLVGLNAGTGINNNLANGTTIVGRDAGEKLTSGIGNSALGYGALTGNHTGGYNTAIGYESAKGVTDNAHSNNVSVGYQSLKAVTTGSSNTALGKDSSASMTDGHNNVAIGNNSLEASTSVGYAVAIGNDAMVNGNATADADGAIAIGASSLAALTSGAKNTALGFAALSSLTTGSNNIAIGYQSMDAADGTETDNIAIGYGAMGAFDENGNAGDDNIAIGRDALKGGAISNNTRYNIAIGNYALDATATNPHEGTIAIGHQALSVLTSGTGCTAVGYQSLDANDTGNELTAVGYQALSATNGAKHGATAIGYKALHQNVSAGTSDYSVAVGRESGDNQTTGYQNTFLGANTTGNDASAVNQTVIGYHAQGQADNTVTLGNDAVTDIFMGDDKGAAVRADSSKVVCQGVEFPATQSASGGANTLDDYEEGVDVVALASASGTVGLDADFNHIGYTKVGRAVHIQGHLYNTTFSSGDGVLTITGLPFTSVGDLNDKADTATFLIRVKDGDSADGFYLGIMLTNTTVITVDGYDAENLNTSTSLHISGTYMTA